ncbi:CRISPR-associated endonuclease Cas3'' [Spirochaeta thermophila]|uniref:CRISPR-associated endonuclease Cas3'' n=1 Tax=Winmispira thermophila TaxID=154 RepID=UPI001FE08B9C|nr:CRISPR-associated endonuclease Cas3'' [Spirochaeta thermophila]
MEGSSTPVDHSTPGALFVKEQFSQRGKEWEPLGMFLAYPIAGHHTGLPNGKDASDHNLFTRLQKTSPLPPHNLQQVAHLLEVSEDALAHQVERLKRDLGRYLSKTPPDLTLAGMYLYLFVKMLYSALVDADFLDTERFMDPERSRLRGTYPSIETLHARFFGSMERFLEERTSHPSPLDAIRGEIYRACLDAAREPQGFFSLTVPTGGGKTLSSS